MCYVALSSSVEKPGFNTSPMSFAQLSGPLVCEDLPAKSSEIARIHRPQVGKTLHILVISRGPDVFTFPLAFPNSARFPQCLASKELKVSSPSGSNSWLA